MRFWAYMLHCRGGYFYVGHTDDLERRVAEHKAGMIAGFTADHLPVELVWSESFDKREDAKAAEAKLKGWSRAKKLALIRGDWDRISALAKNKDSASTSSAWTGRVIGPIHALDCHPDTPALAVSAVSARLTGCEKHWLSLRWRIEGAGRLVVPRFAGRGRADGLWATTCFELFVMGEEGAYAEFNLSPSERWAAYDFSGYRDGMTNRQMPFDPDCSFRPSSRFAIFDAAIPRAGLPELPWRFGLSAVIEETDGTKSYWALAHPPGKPDFHHPTCFAATLAAPSAA